MAINPKPKAGLITKAKNTTETRPTKAKANKFAVVFVFFICVCVYVYTNILQAFVTSKP